MFIVIFVSMDQPQSLKERKYRIIPNNIDREKEKELAKIYNQYKDADAWNMVRATHQKESAWSKHHVKGMRKVIKRDDIKADKELLQEALLPKNKP
ncbi:hypothetical protein RGC24_02540 [Helicobacter pylori]|uniref:hypothetical protein n=1 Tax=Helicobacter pylori TaxID=210 RepID=UPI002929EE9A|nr:hypothetical protein [Helicobacter pylori]MDU9765983.1 hypothetical protein [Helicobacter pylori]